MLSDVLIARVISADRSVLHSELRCHHNVRNRLFIIDMMPPDSTGAELGVFTGLFSSVLARQIKLKTITFVDPWWTKFGHHYGDWGHYTDFGRLGTKQAHDIATRRIRRPGLPGRTVEVATSYEWLPTVKDESLDWIYLDSTHSYEGTKQELRLIDGKLKESGIIFGDDWQTDREHRHHGVFLAVNEFVRSNDYELMLAGRSGQWGIRRRSPKHQ